MADSTLKNTTSLLPVDRTYRIGAYTFNPANRSLTSPTKVITLRPKVSAAMKLLLDRRRIVSHDELATAIWGESAPRYTQGNALHQIVTGLRKVLREIGGAELRCEPRGGYQLLTREHATEITPTPNGQAFPLDRLRVFPQSVGSGYLQNADLVFCVPQPLEVRPEFAKATMQNIEAGARVFVSLPTSQARSIPKLLFNLLLHDNNPLYPDGLAPEPRTLEARCDLLCRSLRLTFITQQTPVHVQIYHADDVGLAVAVVIPPGSDWVFVYAEGREAYDLAASIHTAMPEEETDGIITNPSELSTPQLREIVLSLNRYLGPFNLAAPLIAALGISNRLAELQPPNAPPG
jgi:DNA-binding winged helix-turn-helix (wHTH) protein